jgi:hypothetical protein
MDRGSFLKLGAAGALTLGAGVARAGTPTATPVGDDESFVAFGAVAEGVGAAVYQRALRAHHLFDRHERDVLRAAHAAKREHAGALVAVLGDNADSSSDFTVTFPAASLRTRASLLRLSERLERLVIGVYLSGVAYAQDQNTRALLGEILSADVRQLACVRMLRGLEPLDGKLAPTDIEVAGRVLDRYLSSPDAPDEGNL